MISSSDLCGVEHEVEDAEARQGEGEDPEAAKIELCRGFNNSVRNCAVMSGSEAETSEHISVKQTIAENLVKWFDGITIKEYAVLGHEADVYGVTKDHKRIHVEVVWSPTQFYPNLIALIHSDADVRCIVCRPTMPSKSRSEFEKVKLEELKRGSLFTEIIDADLILQQDQTELDRLRDSLMRLMDRVPPGIAQEGERSYLYIDYKLVSEVVDQLKEPWSTYTPVSQVLLLEEKHTKTPTELGIGEEVNFDDAGPSYLSWLSWDKTHQLVKLYGRIYAPFGLEKEAVVQFVWDPCYSDYLLIQASNIHFNPSLAERSSRLYGPVGIEGWQAPKTFMVGLIRKPSEWQPPLIEPLVLYKSERESTDFHSRLIQRACGGRMSEDAVKLLSEYVEIDKTLKANDIVEREMKTILMASCWDRPTDEIYMLSTILWKVCSMMDIGTKSDDELVEEYEASVLENSGLADEDELTLAQMEASDFEESTKRFRGVLVEIMSMFGVGDRFDEMRRRRIEINRKIVARLQNQT